MERLKKGLNAEIKEFTWQNFWTKSASIRPLYMCNCNCALYTKLSHAMYSIWSIVKGFNGSNNHLCSAHFKGFLGKWEASADSGCQTLTCQSFDPFSLDCLHAGLHKQTGLKIYRQKSWKLYLILRLWWLGENTYKKWTVGPRAWCISPDSNWQLIKIGSNNPWSGSCIRSGLVGFVGIFSPVLPDIPKQGWKHLQPG